MKAYSIVTRIKHPSLLLAFLDRIEGKDLIEAVQAIGLEMLSQIRKENEEKEIFRLQGKLEVVSAISDLRKELQSLLEKGAGNAILEQKRPPAGTA